VFKVRCSEFFTNKFTPDISAETASESILLYFTHRKDRKYKTAFRAEQWILVNFHCSGRTITQEISKKECEGYFSTTSLWFLFHMFNTDKD